MFLFWAHTKEKEKKENQKRKKEKNQIKNSRKSKKEKNQNEEKMKEKNEKNEELCIGVEGFLDKLVFWVFALFLILKNVQRGAVVDTSFCPGYYGSSSPKKNLIAERRKVAQDDFQGGRFLPFNFGLSFNLLNIIIWTSPPFGKLFKIKFSSQIVFNRAIFMDGLKVMD